MSKGFNLKTNTNIIYDIIESRKHLLEMLNKRDYDISKFINQTPDEIQLLTNNNELDIE